MEERALHFNNNSQIYNEVRPGYPDEIYEIVSSCKKFDINSTILEIGSGQGIASREIFDKWHCKLTLLEPGNNLCALLHNKFENNKSIEIENTAFENYQNKILYDAIFSATAFHWLDASIKYKKTHEILKNDGILVLYWNNYGVEDKMTGSEITNLYKKYGTITNDGKSSYERTMEKIENRRKEVEESHCFTIIRHELLKTTKKYTAENYIKLLKTFPDHAAMGKDFFETIKKVILGNGNKIDVRIIVNLEIAKKL
jgi:SAM-dependent methyltransferase